MWPYRQMSFFSQNMDVFPWLRAHHHEFDEVLFHGFFNHVLWELILEDEAFCKKSNWLMFGGDLLMDLYFKENDPLYMKTTEIRKQMRTQNAFYILKYKLGYR